MSTATQRPSTLNAWFWATRPFSLGASAVPVLVGTSVASTVTQVNWTLFILALSGSILIQIGTNLTDEYTDHRRTGGISKYPAPHKVISRGLLSERAVLVGMVVSFGIATGMGLYIVSQVGWPILAVGLNSVAVAYFYSAGPYPIGNLGLGEVTVFFFMGPLMVSAAYFVQTETLAWSALWASLPVAFTVTAIMHCNNLRDIEEDREHGKHTIATLTGWARGLWVYAGLLAAAYVTVTVAALTGALPAFAPLGLITIPIAFQAAQGLWHADGRPAMNRAMVRTAMLHVYTGIWVSLGIALDRAL
ncbi:MAG: 1,4-dihydroxy-2-naphthoate octaprenyltransferase [Chloroflexi bacterium]|nr:1,4-dihydroxy-2-naphthoate octaprenyltransferase [Chloroflexota bacterium]